MNNMSKSDVSHKCATCPTRHRTEWRDLSSSELELVEQGKHARNYQPGELLYHQGDASDGIYCIQEGLVGSRFIDSDGNSALLRLSKAGTTIGYRAFLTKQSHGSSAEVLSPSFICFIQGSVLSKLLAANPHVGERFLQHTVEDLEETENRFARSLTGNLRNRFLHMIMIFYQQHGYHDENNNPIVELPIKRSDIAEMIGSQPESLSRVISNVQKQRLLKFDGRRVLITDMETILDEVGIAL
jgi:CRP-like cAMP-binding protein